ncbi:virion structural protein [Pseudomonas phage Phabio]|uniref:Virion structural protein n=1 Tax=Pseudomonas phage Phabio TaxID=2006668 RepID=A0A1Y0STN3_9CAUD|nr:virion structural protein [Pseudomonas phage Phabio]ARV76832.1 virion structural protein [Pseudomonas phage Phabio]
MAQKLPVITYPKLAAQQLGSKATPTNALLNQLRKDPSAGSGEGSRPRVDINRFTMDKVSRNTSQEITDSDAVMQTLPDLELVETVVVGSTIDPKSLNEPNLLFTVDQSLFDSELGALLLEPIETYFKKDYKIDDRLDLILRDCLFYKGSSILCVLPENVLDNLINGRRQVTMENFKQADKIVRAKAGESLGMLGSPKEGDTVSLEGYGNDETLRHINGCKYLTVTDNPEVLKLPGISDVTRATRIKSKLSRYRVSMEEEVHKFDNAQIENLYNATMAGSENTQIITSPKFMNRPSVGHPLVMPFPSESIIPVFVQGRPYEHVGYFLLVDQNGYPVSKDSTRDFYGELQSGWKSGTGGNSNSEVLRLTREAMGDNANKSDYEVDHIQNAYNAIIVNDLNNRLRNGMYDQELEVGLTQEVQRIMLYRNWKAKSTQLVFIPQELLTYIAFDYNANGIGETLISRTKILSTIRTTLLFAETMGGIKNAMGRKKVSITTDAHDPDPEATIDGIQSLILEQGQRAFPLAAPDPAQTMDALVRSGYDFEINSNGAAYAETKVQYDDYNTTINAGNPELQDRIRRMHISAFGIPPEKVDPMSSPDFATSIVQNDLVASRKVKERQKAFCAHLTKFIRTFTDHSSILRNRMYEIARDNIAMITAPELKSLDLAEIVDQFILAVEVGLPAPDNTQHERQLEALEVYERLLDKGLESWVSSDLFPEEFTQVPGLAEDVLAQIKAAMMRKNMAANNILPELDIFTEMDGDKPAFSILDFVGQKQATMTKAFLEYAKHSQLFKKRLSELYAKVFETAADGDNMDAGSDYGDDSSSEGDDDFGGSSFDSMDDLQASDDSGFNMDEPGNSTPEETTDGEPNLDGLEDPMQAEEAEQEADVAEEPPENVA